MLTFGAAGCGYEMPAASADPPAADRRPSGALRPLLPVTPPGPPSPDVYRLPWACGEVYPVNQGNHGDICGVHGDHVGVQEYAWDFGMPARTAVLASRAGVVTLAITPSPPGSQCHDGCPFAFGSSEHQTCCSACLAAANRVNVRHEDGAISTYAHFDELAVQAGQTVRAGQLLGYSGTSGCSTGPHLHFQVMAGCERGYCQSLPMTFDEVGIPVCGDQVASQNDC